MKVLSVTDGGMNSEGVERLLRGTAGNVEVLTYASFNDMPAETRAAYQPDLILLEDRPKVCNVFECMSDVLSLVPGVPMIVLLRDEGSDYQQRAVREGARGVANVGVRRQMFGAIVNIVMAGGIYVPEPLLRTLLRDRETAPAVTHLRQRRDGGPALTERQMQVLDLLCTGLSNKEIAFALEIEPSTVKQHLHAIFGVLGVDNRTQAASRILEERKLRHG